MTSSADVANLEATHTSQANGASLSYTKASAVNNLQINATQTSTSSYIPALNGLRALAAMCVFLVHFQQFTQFEASFGVVDIERWMINGNTGVALFFVLSGFLLSMPFWHANKKHTVVSMRDYFINRSIRIIPIYYLCIFALLMIKGFSGPDVNFNNLLSHLFFLHNLKDYQVLSLNPPFWTLAVEFQFYLFLPLFFYALMKLSYRSSQVVCAISIPLIYLAYRLLMSALEHWQDWPIAVPLIWPFGIDITSPDGPALTYSLFAHLPHFLIGVLAASFYRATDSKFAEAAFWLSGVLIFIILATPLDELMQVDFGRYNFPFIPILLGIIVFSAPLSRVAGGLLELRLLKWMGIISYGIYLYHYPIQKAVKHGFEAFNLAVNQYAGLFLFGSLALTLAIAHVSYLLVEQPIMRRFKQRGMLSSVANMGSSSELTSNLSTIKNSSSMPSNLPLASESNIPSASNARARKSFYPFRIAMLCTVVVSLSGYFIWKNTENTIVIEQVPWAGSAAPEMIFDHHTHTQYSDGSLSVPDLVEMAFFKGCDAFAITDHNSGGSLSDKKFTEIAKMRDAYPGLLIFAGMELGMPATEGREHVSIITTPRFERALLTTILHRQSESQSLALEQRDRFALDLIDNIPLARGQTIAIYNHPSRKDDSARENLEDIKNWNQQHRNIVAFAGAPGHQKSETLGSYAHVFKPIERWDPVVAEVGGTWDTLLSEGHRIWGAIASSDYHNDSLDYPPCEFSRIHVQTPSTSYEGLIKGIQAGTFWADHGKLLEQYDFYLQADLKSPPVFAGGEITLNTSAQVVSVNVDLVRGDAHADAFLRFDMISNCSTEQTSLSSQYIPPEENSSTLLLVLPPTPKDCFVRSRIVKETIDGLNLSAYSNPIFISF
jgi:peptidoglycan/LPS O-acetylase OafA/YrhL/predicted metal-dependent phosphoesterase TrpH